MLYHPGGSWQLSARKVSVAGEQEPRPPCQGHYIKIGIRCGVQQVASKLPQAPGRYRVASEPQVPGRYNVT
jgi:hypothetical protein